MQNTYTDGWASLRQVFEQEGFQADARRIASVPSDQFEAALGAVAQSPGVLKAGGLRKLLEVIADPAQREAVSRFLTTITAWRGSRLSGGPHEAFAARLRSELEEATEGAFTADEAKVVADRTQRIGATPFPALELLYKGYSLVNDVGQHLSRATVVCDLRPVFDDTRTRVEALIPITTLKVVAMGEDEAHPESFEVCLSEAEVEDLATKLETAKRKIAALKTFVATTGAVVPDSPMLKREGT